MTILITGATGSVGRHVVDSLLAAGASVRALTRAPGTAKLPAGVELAEGDLTDPTSLDPGLFDEVDRMFVFPANSGIDELMQRAAASGVGSFVVLSSLAAAGEHARDIGSASYVHHRAIERAVTSRTENWTILRPGTFANNLLSWAYSIRSGSPVRAPYLRSAQAPVHEADVADVAAAALLNPAAHSGQIHPLTGPQALTRIEQVAAIGDAIGRRVEVVEITPDEFRAEVSAFVPQDIIAMLLDYWSDTVDEPDRVRPASAVIPQVPRTLAQWARDHRADFGAAD